MTSSEESAWRPATPAITANNFAEIANTERNIAVHFWAEWNNVDKQYAKRINKLLPRLSGWVSFYSCDIDNPSNGDWIAKLGVVNAPTLIVFVDGEQAGFFVGLQSELHLANQILTALNTENRYRPWWKFWKPSA